LDDDPFCFSCRAPFGKNGKILPGAEKGKPAYAVRLSMILGCVGACVGPIFGRDLVLVESPHGGGLDLNQVIWAGIGGAVAGTLGLLLGMLLFGDKSRE
jgi:uncharacterized membrane protein YeaQ/YmgE (transglycosylase-associated protein family)